jgi:predicted MPP superfamily phosphohydrolase
MPGHVAESPVAAQRKGLSRRQFLVRSSLVAAGGLAVYSGEFARHEISVVTQPLIIANLPEPFRNFRVVQISDIHFDEYTEPSFLRRVIDQINQLTPDLVLLTGDFISMHPLGATFAQGAMVQCAEILGDIVCRQRFAVMGNHDSFLGAPLIGAQLASVGIPLLVDEYVPIERSGFLLWLCGVNDPVTLIPDLDLAIPEQPDGPVLLMSHGPDFADTLLAHPRGRLVDAMFSGHSHGGQVRIPFLGPMQLPEGGRKYVEGLFRFGGLQLYVNRGIGAVGLPFRLNCPPEITLFTLQSA